MTERPPISELCVNCPNRSKLSRALARLVSNNEVATDCDGRVVITRGDIATFVRRRGETTRIPFDWSFSSGSASGDCTYSKITWSTQAKCGRDPLLIGVDEIMLPERGSTRREDGSRRATLISGSPEALRDYLGILGIIDMLDAVSDIQAAERRGDAQAIESAHDKIAAHGFALQAVVGGEG